MQPGRLAGFSLFLVFAWPQAERIAAFDSYGLYRIHDEITDEGAAAARFPETRKAGLREAVRAPDWEETNKLRLRPNERYAASHHFDRGPETSHAEAFAAGTEYVRGQMELAAVAIRAGDGEAMLQPLGRALHASQDFISHSNFIDLAPAEQEAVLAALWDAAAEAPETLKITAVDPAAAKPGLPPGEEFAHDAFAKDNPRKNDEAKALVGEHTKFELARAAAVALTEDLLLRVLRQAEAPDWSAVR